ncbi:RHS repeat-associated core domain-containing protein [Pectobacterium zantedeschiae]|uniref:RHS repeat-associated core domain-containing protein n=1 Tax=Pectobacterium zantedeschiae TaxID=2034769 RepID=UPI00101E0E68|nr:RHS repeat-associated core domain-containing protein [Pectobacterium zantedeschiae]RYC39743.1 type IV secretion protein Rhs [Pectobacterium zantedeschiae]
MATGNTIGKLQYAPAPQGHVTAGSANPPKQKSWWSRYGDWVHTGLDVLGAVPIIGAVADGANAAIYTAEGDYGNAALSAASAAANFVPGGGAAFKAGKLAAKAGKAVDAVKAGKKAVKEGAVLAEKAAMKAEATAVKAESKVVKKEAGETIKAKKAGSEKGGSNKGHTQKNTEPCKIPQSPLPQVDMAIGSPVNPLLGIKVLFEAEDNDFSFPASVPLNWQRYYFSDEIGNGWLGQGWSLPFSQEMRQHHQQLVLIDEQGREIAFPYPQLGHEPQLHRYEQLSLSQPQPGEFCISSADGGQHWHFAHQAGSGRWLLSAIADRHNNRLTLHYNAQHLPVQIEDSAGRRFHIHVTLLSLADGSTVERITGVSVSHPSEPLNIEKLCSYDYSPQGDLIAVRNELGDVLREFRYRNHMMVAHRRAGEMECFYHYDRHTPDGKVLAHRDSLGGEWRFEYGHNCTTVTDVLGRVTRYDVDEHQELIGYRDAMGGNICIQRNVRGQMTQLTDQAGRVTRYRYDERGNCTAVSEPDGQTTRFDYHERWNLPVRVTDMLGGTREYHYDIAGNLIRVTDEIGRITEYNHDDRGNLVRIRDAAAGVQQLCWNSADFLVSHTDCSGRTTTFEYDKYGWLKQQTDAAGHRTTLYHGRDGQPLRIVQADGSTERAEFDRWQRLTAWHDAQGQVTRWTLAADGLPLTRTDALGHQVGYEYDPARRLTALINENGARHTFSYDARDNLLCERGFDGNTTRYEFDDGGYLQVRMEDGDGCGPCILTRYQRDAAGRLLEKLTARGGDTRWQRTRYGYDALGRLTTGVNHGGRVELEWDDAGQLKTERTLIRGVSYELHHQYDELGNRTHTQLPDGHELKHFYYGSGHRLQVNLGSRIISESERDVLHREVRRTQGAIASDYVHDEMGRLVSQRAGGGGKTAVARDYVWRRDGQLMQMVDKYTGDHRYEYDVLGRLTLAGDERFAFDPAHNLLNSAQAQPLQNNRLQVFEDKRWAYDSFGNVAEKRIGRHTAQQFSWSAEHQLTAAVSTRNGTPQRTTYGYDAFGRRSWKRDTFGVTHFIWDGNRLLSEVRGSRHHLWIYGDEGFVPLAQVSLQQGETEHEAQVYWYHNDVSGLPREMTGQDGNLVWRAEYRAWGNTVRVEQAEMSHSEPVHQPLRYQGQYFDAETGLHYNRFRYYDPDAGRFVSQDPIGLAGGLNLYQYAPNPIGWVDPLGLNGHCAFGNKSKPRAPRPGKDIDVDANGMVKSQADELLPQGASTTLDPNKSPLSGHYHTIPEGSKLPDGLGIKVDGKDVIPGSPHAAGHATIYPTRDMSMTEFQNLFDSIHWQYGGKI